MYKMIRLLFICTCILMACNKDPNESVLKPPFLVLKGENPIWHQLGTTFIDPGAKAYGFNNESDTILLNTNIPGLHEINTNEIGLYLIQYSFEDANGTKAETISRKVYVNQLQ